MKALNIVLEIFPHCSITVCTFHTLKDNSYIFQRKCIYHFQFLIILDSMLCEKLILSLTADRHDLLKKLLRTKLIKFSMRLTSQDLQLLSLSFRIQNLLIEAMQTELRKMGARIEVDGDTVHIQGVALHAPNAPLSGHNDHRIVMALAVAAIASGLPALLCGAEAVDKSWPAFWSVLRGLGAKVELNTDKQEEFDIKA